MSVDDLAVDGTLNTTNQQSDKPDGLCLRKTPLCRLSVCRCKKVCKYNMCLCTFFVLISLTNKKIIVRNISSRYLIAGLHMHRR